MMETEKNKKFTYADAGVNIDHGNELVSRIKTSSQRTQRSGVMGSLGGFGALFDIGSLNYKHPVLVSGTDGVGTKIKLAIETNRHDTIGIDLVAMCVNDLIVQGAEPLFFLDYFASSKLNVDVAETVITGIAKGCEISNCSLIGGETAEMPGMYSDGDYDLAGFCVGAVEKDEIIDGKNVQVGDVLIAVASSGFHSNGYSLIRKIINDTQQDLSQKIAQRTLIDCLLEPTRIYVKPVLELTKTLSIKAISHITGGGLTENIPRVIPEEMAVEIDTNSWQLPPVFEWIKTSGNVDKYEMLKTFNCGAGLVLCIAAEDKDKVIEMFNTLEWQAWHLGEVIKRNEKLQTVNYI